MGVIKFLLFSGIFLIVSVSYSYETDQYSVPPAPLADVGEDLSGFIHRKLEEGVAEINRDRIELPEKIRKLEQEIARYPVHLFEDALPDYPGREVYERDKFQLKLLQEKYEKTQNQFGIISLLHKKYSGSITWNEQRDGVFGMGLGYLPYKGNSKQGQMILFNHGKLDTIYSFAGFHRIISPSYFVFASSLKAYGVHMGVDKFGHFINQGFQYLEKYRESLSRKESFEKAFHDMIQWGVDSEEGIFGVLVDGVYSNADLAANFAGFIFYQNFFKDITVGDKVFPRILEVTSDGSLALSQNPLNSQKNLLRRFITDHLDESLNPSVLESLQRGPVRSAIQRRCEYWLKYYGFKSGQDVERLTQPLNNWFGYSYGHKSQNSLRIQDICFSKNGQ